jgi:glucuronate isomerase
MITTASAARADCQNRQFENLTQIWLAGDTINGGQCGPTASKSVCTGSASDWEKFEKWA